MSEVKRYNPMIIERGEMHIATCGKVDNGKYVLYTDYQAAQARIEKLEQANRVMRQALEHYSDEHLYGVVRDFKDDNFEGFELFDVEYTKAQKALNQADKILGE